MASNSRRFTAGMWMARTTAALAGQSNTGQPLSNPSPVLTWEKRSGHFLGTHPPIASHPSQARDQSFRPSPTVPPGPFYPMASNSRRFMAEIWMARTTAALAGRPAAPVQSNTSWPLSSPSPVLT